MLKASAAAATLTATVVVLCGIGKCGVLGPSVGEKLQIASAPEGATVKLDGVEVGTTPLTLTELDVEEGQTQTLTFEMDGYVTTEETVTWKLAEQSVAATLEQDVKERVFTVKSVPSGATVFIDGVEKGETPTTFSREMKDGEEFNLLVQHKGYDDITEKVTVEEDTSIKLAFNFKREGGEADEMLDDELTKTEKKWRRACKTIGSDICKFEYQIGSAGNVTDVDSIKCNYKPITNCTKRMIKKMVFKTEGNARADAYRWTGRN